MGDTLGRVAERLGADWQKAVPDDRMPFAVREVGRVVSIGYGVCEIEGFTDIAANELIALPGNLVGLAASLSERRVGVILLGDSSALEVGADAHRTHRVSDAPVGEALLGRIVDALGRPIDGHGTIDAAERQPIEAPAAPIMDRAAVSVPLQTGIKAIDAVIPIGRGQRELILGDRQTGKSTIAIDAILNQGDDVVSVYCAIGQRSSAVARAIDVLRRGGALERTIVVVASGDDAPGLQYIAPYAATTMAERFMRRGRDVLIVYDDLTRHARAYRELSLLLRRPPGREAYPGDIFFVHARLLERATHLNDTLGGGSMTALPIVETQARNISAYIPTNLVSITDGQIYLSPDLFRKGVLPAIDIGMSVSRVGGEAQLPAYRAVAGDLKLAYSQFEELETFARFGSRLDPATQDKLNRGRRVREILKQGEHEQIPVAEQIAVLLAATSGLLDKVEVDAVREAEQAIRTAVRQQLPDFGDTIRSGEVIDVNQRQRLLDCARSALAELGVDLS